MSKPDFSLEIADELVVESALGLLKVMSDGKFLRNCSFRVLGSLNIAAYGLFTATSAFIKVREKQSESGKRSGSLKRKVVKNGR